MCDNYNIIIMLSVGEFHVREHKQFKLQWQSIKNATYNKKHRQHIYRMAGNFGGEFILADWRF